ncbi:MAG: hypothetical protein NXI16_04930 [Alphaproteobacteria bacterium]|nr:hypothetical protein [Alphaproteobacteria bacterium]
MYRDNSLIPTEALRLAALGLLAESPRIYAELARDVRRFVSRLSGPSLELLVPSLELLRFEGLVEPADKKDQGETSVVRLTAEGEEALKTLLRANVRPQVNDFNKLVMALKLRFIEFLDREERLAQLDLLEDIHVAERNRLMDLQANDPDIAKGFLAPWIEMELAQAEARISWVQQMVQDAEKAA